MNKLYKILKSVYCYSVQQIRWLQGSRSPFKRLGWVNIILSIPTIKLLLELIIIK